MLFILSLREMPSAAAARAAAGSCRGHEVVGGEEVVGEVGGCSSKVVEEDKLHWV